VAIQLAAGPNLLVFKVRNIHGGWGLRARLTDPQGRTMWDLRQP
jgi:hypothetical protein